MTTGDHPIAGLLRGAARLALGLGALAALALTLYTGRHNSSVLLVTMFSLWVISPFAGFTAATRAVRGVRGDIAAATDAAAVVVALCSVAIYAVIAFGPPRRQTAFAFVVVPAASWLAVLPVFLAIRLARKRTGQTGLRSR